MFLRTLDAYGLARDAFVSDYSAPLRQPFEHHAGLPQKKSSYNFRTAIISDTHLGRKAAFAEYLLEFLDNVIFDKLIINGDGFDGLNWSGNAYEDLP